MKKVISGIAEFITIAVSVDLLILLIGLNSNGVYWNKFWLAQIHLLGMLVK